MLFVRPLGLALSVVLAGCAAIPELQFDDDAGDAGASLFPGVPRGDASFVIDGAADGEPVPAIDAAPVAPESNDASQGKDTSPAPPPAADAAPPPPGPGCPSTTPAGATMCCGFTPCVGSKCSAHCAECFGCTGSVCCVAPNGKTATCAASASACPHDD